MIKPNNRQENSVNLKPKVDTFEPKDKKSNGISQEKSTESKKSLGVVAGVGLAAMALFLLAKGKTSQAKILAKEIKFKPAQTVEEAIDFGRKHFGIKKYQGFENKDLNVLNWINEGFVNTSNKMGGKLRMPKSVCYTDDFAEDSIAGVITQKGHPLDGLFGINKNFFENIDKQILERLQIVKDKGILTDKRYIDKNYLKNLINQVEKYKQGETVSFNDKVKFYESLTEALNVLQAPFTSPLNSIKAILQNTNATQYLKTKGILTDIDKIQKLSTKEQKALFIKMITDGEIPVVFGEGAGKNISPFSTIYHEMGHIQDMTPRCLTIDKYNFDYSKYPNELKAWVNNQENMQTANRVSGYASHGPGEFVAETFAKMINGNKLPDDVIALYKKLNGPFVPGY